MLKRLKWKIVFFICVPVVLLLAAITAVSFWVVYRHENQKIERRLSQAIDFYDSGEVFLRDLGGTFGGRDDLPKMNSSDFVSGSAVAVILDESNRIFAKTEFSATMSDEALSFAVDKVLAGTRTDGYLTELGVRFKIADTAVGRCIAFTDRIDLENSMKLLGYGTGIVDLTITLLVVILGFLAASVAVKPVKEAWTTQKQFIADASHELKTPLTVILANTNILQSHAGEIGEEQLQWIDSTKDEAERMKQLLDQMLYLAKSDADATKVVLADTDVSELTERTALCFDPVAFEKNVELQTSVIPGIHASVDRVLYERLVGILIDNAIKHSPENSPVKISLGKEGGKTVLYVNNGGDLIAAEDIPRLFDRFYRGDKVRTTDSADNGFGLGLSIAKDITDKFGGTIGVTSTPTYGTTFRVSI